MKNTVLRFLPAILLLIGSLGLISSLTGCIAELDSPPTSSVSVTSTVSTTTTTPVLTTKVSEPTVTTQQVPDSTPAVTTEKTPDMTMPVTHQPLPAPKPPVTSETVETLPPLEITIPIPDPGELPAQVESEIITACAKRYDEDPETLSVRLVANLGDAYAVFVDCPNWMYGCDYVEHIVHGYLFAYSSTHTMTIYKDGQVYTLPEAYEQGALNAHQVLDLYLIYADQEGYLGQRNPEKVYCSATVQDDFKDNRIIIVTFSEYNLYSYTVEDFAEIGCIALQNLWYDQEDLTKVRIISLTLGEQSKQNVLDCIKILQQRIDLKSVEPSYNIAIDD